MAEQSEIAEIIKNIQADVTTIVKGEIELAKAELLPQAKTAGVGAGLFGGAGYLAITAGTLLFLSISFGVSLAFLTWAGFDLLGSLAAGFALVAVVLLGIAGILALIGKQKMVFARPEATVAQAEASVAAVKDAVTRGKGEVAALSLTKGPGQAN